MNQGNRIIQVAVPRPLHAVYDYSVPESMPIPNVGARLKVPFGRTQTIGVFVKVDVTSPHKSPMPIIQIIDDDAAISGELLDLANWMSTYYHHPLGEVLATILPNAARKGLPFVLEEEDFWHLARPEYTNPRAPKQTGLVEYMHEHLVEYPVISGKALVDAGFSRAMLNKLAELEVINRVSAATRRELAAKAPALEASAEQHAAIDAIEAAAGRFEVLLLEGVTGSGKTEVYLQSMAPVLARGGQVMVLVPEIALTPQTLARFEKRFGQVGMLHSALTDKKRLQTWLRCRDGELNILIGTRSAVFTPFKQLDLIIVDEEHDSSYKQQEGLRYSARDLTAKRAHSLGIPLVLGSATPSLESIYNVSRKRYTLLKLPHRAGGASMPTYNLIDLRGQTLQDGFSRTLVDVIRHHLAAEGQVLIYLNRRGFAPTLLCQSCGWQCHCSDCDAKLTLHRSPAQMICHHCMLKFQIPELCEHCGQPNLLPVGLGTQRAEDAVEALFPNVPIYRVDRDTTRTNRQLGEQLDKINQGSPCIMVGTQMLAKGHHFPSVTLVVVLNADSGFLSPDFRAPERTAQLVVQVAGRAGRAERPGEVWIQTYQPENPVLTKLIEEGYAGFAQEELKTREEAGLPPILPMAMLRAEAEDGRIALDFLQTCKNTFNSMGRNQVEVMGPIPAPMARIANRFRYQLMLIAPTRSQLHQLLHGLGRPKVPTQLRWSIDVDPYDAL